MTCMTSSNFLRIYMRVGMIYWYKRMVRKRKESKVQCLKAIRVSFWRYSHASNDQTEYNPLISIQKNNG